MAVITARYPGDCEDCGGQIYVGDLIESGAPGEWVHAGGCDGADLDKVETVCGTCFLTSCDCGGDV